MTASEVLNEWLRADPRGAGNYLKQMHPELMPYDREFYRNWGAADLDGAAAYLAVLPEEEPAAGMAEALGRTFRELGRRDDGLRWMESLSPQRREVARRVLTSDG